MNRYLIEGIARDINDGKLVIVVDVDYNHEGLMQRVVKELEVLEMPAPVERVANGARLLRAPSGGSLDLLSSGPAPLDGRRFEVALVSEPVTQGRAGERLLRTLKQSARKMPRGSEIIFY